MAETIMVVEDDRQMARELVRLLENYGYRALQVEDFSRAVEEILEADRWARSYVKECLKA